jgi:MFS family permease
VWRAVIAVVVGYAAMFALVAASFTVIQLGLGNERVFRAGSYEVSGLFLALAIGVSTLVALVGGYVAAIISRSWRGPAALAVAVALLGAVELVMRWKQLDSPAPARAGDVTPFDAAQKARQPKWYLEALPVIGVVGVLAGARMTRRK